MHMVASVILASTSVEVASPRHLSAFSFSSLSSKHPTTASRVSMLPGTIAEISVGQAATPLGQYWVAQALAASRPAWLLKSISAVQRRMLPGSILSFFWAFLPPCRLPPLAGTA